MGHMPLHHNESVTNTWRLDTPSRLASAAGRQCERFSESGTRLLKPYPSSKIAPFAA